MIRNSLKFSAAFMAAMAVLVFTAAPLSEGIVTLKIHEIKIKKENHRNKQNVIACNVTDTDSGNYGTIGTKLPSSVTYRANPSSAPSSVRNNLGTIVQNSFDTWQVVTSGVAFAKGSNTSQNRARFDGQNIIAWNRLSSNTLGTTYIWYNGGGTVMEVDTILNSRVAWRWTDPTSLNVDQTCPSTNAYDVQNILTHELGHWMGLDDLYSPADEDLTMYGYGSKQELKKDTLESGDVSGASEIYP